MSACLGSSAVGARTFTATASQGLELMHEVLFVAASLRLPIILLVANRALSGPLNIWGDHSDVMSTRDTGWIQFFAENGQQAFDLTLCAFRSRGSQCFIARDVKRGWLPCITRYRAYIFC